MTAPGVDSWRPADIPDQTGRTVVVTGPSTGGLGFHVALELARRGSRVVLAGRSAERLAAAAGAIHAQVPTAHLEQLRVDLADLGSVRRSAADAAAYGPIDVLVNNAGVMATPRKVTTDGLDLQMATNHFGPFLLTGLLLPQLVAAAHEHPEAGGSRVVVVSSVGHRLARSVPLGDPRRHRGPYNRWGTYGRTKLANLLFTYDLDRRLREAGLPVRALAAHPGVAGTHLVANGLLGRSGRGRSAGGLTTILDAASRAVSQPADLGAWPVLMAATADLPGATYVGPGGLGELGGAPQVVTSSAASHDTDGARRLWELSEDVTGTCYPPPPA